MSGYFHFIPDNVVAVQDPLTMELLRIAHPFPSTFQAAHSRQFEHQLAHAMKQQRYPPWRLFFPGLPGEVARAVVHFLHCGE